MWNVVAVENGRRKTEERTEEKKYRKIVFLLFVQIQWLIVARA